MSDAARGLKYLMFSSIIYIIIGLIYAGAGGLTINLPAPPSPPHGGLIDWVGFIVKLVAYPFQMFFSILGIVFAVMTLNFIPSPFNWLFAVPLALIFFYGLFLIILGLLEKVGSIVPI